MGIKITVKNTNYLVDLNVSVIGSIVTDYVAATGLTSQSEISAIESFITSLVVSGTYSKMDAMYLFVGDTYDKVKINIVNNATYTLGTIPLSNINNGIDLTGMAGVSTGFIGGDAWLLNGHLALYNSTVETQGISIPLHDTIANDGFAGKSLSRNSGGNNSQVFGLKGTLRPLIAGNNEVGLFVGTALSGQSTIYSKSVEQATYTDTFTPPSVNELTIGTDTIYKSNMILQVVSVGSNLTSGDVSVYNAACETLTATLGR